MASLGVYWRVQASPGVFWRPFGVSWRLLACPGMFWPVLACPGVSFRAQASPGVSWRLVARPGFGWRVLASCPVCPRGLASLRRLLASPGVFSDHRCIMAYFTHHGIYFGQLFGWDAAAGDFLKMHIKHFCEFEYKQGKHQRQII